MSDLKCDAFLVSRGGIETKHESKTSRRKAAASGDGKDFCSPDSFTCNVLKMSGVGRRTREMRVVLGGVSGGGIVCT